MAKTYAYIYGEVVQQIIASDDIASCYSPEFVADCADISDVSPQPALGWSANSADGVWTFSAPVAPVVTLQDQAKGALSAARTQVYNNYGILNEATPDAWVTYLKALMAIANGSDTASTALPSAPAS